MALGHHLEPSEPSGKEGLSRGVGRKFSHLSVQPPDHSHTRGLAEPSEAPLGQARGTDKQASQGMGQASAGSGSPEPLAGLPGRGAGAARPLSGFSEVKDTGLGVSLLGQGRM